MKRLYPLLIIIFMPFWGCEDDEAAESDPVNPLVGSWNLTSVAYTSYHTNPSETVTYTADGETTYEIMILTESGTFSYQGVIDGGDMQSGSGTWSSTDEILTYIEDGETTLWTYNMTNNDNWSCYIEFPENNYYYARRTEYSWMRD